MDSLPNFSRSVAALTVNLDTHPVHLFFRKLVFLSFLPSSLISNFLYFPIEIYQEHQYRQHALHFSSSFRHLGCPRPLLSSPETPEHQHWRLLPSPGVNSLPFRTPSSC